MKFIIYGLHDPRTGEIRYVGKSSTGLARPRQHIGAMEMRHKSHKRNWVKGLLDEGLRPDISVLEECESGENLALLEQLAISHYRAMGFRLTNQTDGGDGAPGFVHSAETRSKMSASKKGVPKPPRSEEHKAKLAIAGRRAKWTPERRAAFSAYRTGRKHSPEHCEAIRRGKASGKKIDNAHWIGRHHTPETKAKISARLMRNRNNRHCRAATIKADAPL